MSAPFTRDDMRDTIADIAVDFDAPRPAVLAGTIMRDLGLWELYQRAEYARKQLKHLASGDTDTAELIELLDNALSRARGEQVQS